MVMILGALTLKILLCLLCAHAMQSKGRSWWAGLILGLLLNVFGILIIMLIKPNAEFTEQQIREGRIKKCPNCDWNLKPDAVVCRFCHSEFLPPQTVMD